MPPQEQNPGRGRREEDEGITPESFGRGFDAFEYLEPDDEHGVEGEPVSEGEVERIVEREVESASGRAEAGVERVASRGGDETQREGARQAGTDAVEGVRRSGERATRRAVEAREHFESSEDQSDAKGLAYDFGFAEDAMIVLAELSGPARRFVRRLYERANESVGGAVKRAEIKVLHRADAMFQSALLEYHAMRSRPFEQRHKENQMAVAALQKDVDHINSRLDRLSPAAQRTALQERQGRMAKIERLKRKQDRWRGRIDFRNDKKTIYENKRKDIVRETLDTVSERLSPVEARLEARQSEYDRIVREINRLTQIKTEVIKRLAPLEKQLQDVRFKFEKQSTKELIRRVKQDIKDIGRELDGFMQDRTKIGHQLARLRKKTGKWNAVRDDFTRVSQRPVDYYRPQREDVGPPDLEYRDIGAPETPPSPSPTPETNPQPAERSQTRNEQLIGQLARATGAAEMRPPQPPQEETSGHRGSRTRVSQETAAHETEVREARTKDGVVFRVGERAQWESQGALQFKEPKSITRFDVYDDKIFAFFEDVKTGVPVEQLRKAEQGGLVQENKKSPFAAGQEVRWIKNGNDQFGRARRIVRIQDVKGQLLAFFEGKQSGVPVEELQAASEVRRPEPEARREPPPETRTGSAEMRQEDEAFGSMEVGAFLKRWNGLFDYLPIEAEHFQDFADSERLAKNVGFGAMVDALVKYFGELRGMEAPSRESLIKKVRRVFKKSK